MKGSEINTKTIVRETESETHSDGKINVASTLYAEVGGNLVESLEESDKQTLERSFPLYLNDDDSEAVYDIDNLIMVLENLKEHVDNKYVKLRFSDEKPISFLTKDNDCKVMATLAPIDDESLIRGRFDPIEANLIGWEVSCEEDDCDWGGARYRSPTIAEEAAKDHRYFTGHDSEIKDFQGNEVEWK